MESLPDDALLSIIEYWPPERCYTIYRISRRFRKILYRHYTNNKNPRGDLLWKILHNFSVNPNQILDHVFENYWNWCSTYRADYGFFHLLYYFNFTYSSKKLFSILCKKNDISLIKHLLPHNHESSNKILKYAIRDSRIEIFDHVYNAQLSECYYLHSLMSYLVAIPYFNGEMFQKVLNLMEDISIEKAISILSKLFAKQNTQFTELVLSKTQEILFGEDYYALKRLAYRYTWGDQQKQVITTIRKFFPFRNEKNDRISLNGSGIVKVHGKLVYTDILYIVNKLGSKKPSKIYKNLGYSTFLQNKVIVEKVLNLLQQEERQEHIDIATGSGVYRYIIYKLCEFLGLRFIRIDRKGTNTLECRDFSLCDTVCGCDNVPAKIKKYENGLDWDDRYFQYEVPWTWKIGVRVFFSDSSFHKNY